MGQQRAAILEIEHLDVSYYTPAGRVDAVRDVSLRVERGETLGIVGESGCGKSTLAFAVMRYLGRNGRIRGGRILLHGENLLEKSEADLRTIRGSRIAMVYQDPQSSLNPAIRVGEQIGEVLRTHRGLTSNAAWQESLKMLDKVHMPDPKALMHRYPHQLSGGMQQRVLIAIALCTNPDLLIMDEPTTGLDVTVEAVVLDLVNELKRDFDTATIYISHNMGVIAKVCDRVAVMYTGEIVEEGNVRDIFHGALHPYSVSLLGCVPKLGTDKESVKLQRIPGRLPELIDLPVNCAFEPRCRLASEECRPHRPELVEVVTGHRVRCFRWRQTRSLDIQVKESFALPTATYRVSHESILDVKELKKYYDENLTVPGLPAVSRRRAVKALDGVSFESKQGQTIGIVGESGCGKTTLAKCIIGLLIPSGGKIEFSGEDITVPVQKRAREVHKGLQMVFQNPDSSLNPKHSVRQTIMRPLQLFGVERSDLGQRVSQLLRAVDLEDSCMDRYPNELSGGQKQRVAIARAFAGDAKVVLCDEAISSLDVSVQASILSLLLELQRGRGTSYVFISHDLSVVRYLADWIGVIYLGRLCEIGRAEDVFAPPYHPYTEALLSAVPVPDPDAVHRRIRLQGPVPSAIDPPAGCPFHTRCWRKIGETCETMTPPWHGAGNGHFIRCHIPLDELRQIEPFHGTLDDGSII